MRRNIYILSMIAALFCCTKMVAQEGPIRFYWHYVHIAASEGGEVYATGDWRLPLGEEDYGIAVDVRWVIADTNTRSSCYAWAVPGSGYHFAGWYKGETCVARDSVETRLWTYSDVAMTEDGIVSGNNLYPAFATDTIYARFEPNVPTAIISEEQMEEEGAAYDLLGRKISTSSNGYIIITRKQKRMQLR